MGITRFVIFLYFLYFYILFCWCIDTVSIFHVELLQNFIKVILLIYLYSITIKIHLHCKEFARKSQIMIFVCFSKTLEEIFDLRLCANYQKVIHVNSNE